MTARIWAFILVSGLMAVFVGMLTLATVAYGRRLARMGPLPKGWPSRALSAHLFLIALSFLMCKFLNFATIAYDVWDPVHQFPFWIRIPWDLATTVIGIVALGRLITFEESADADHARPEEPNGSQP